MQLNVCIRYRGIRYLVATLSLGLGLTCHARAAGKSQASRAGPGVSVAQKLAGNTKPGTNSRPSGRPIRLILETEPEGPILFESVPDPGDGDLHESMVTIDLSSALRLAGVENLELVLARQRVEAVVAQQQLAAAQILPNLNLGSNYDSHTGLLQQASGNILSVQRSALYVGAGANAVAAGTVSIPGLQYNLNVSESIYGYFASRQRSEQARFANQAAQNEVLLRVARAYTDLLRAQGLRSLAILTRNDAREVARLTANYVKTGEGRPADAERAATELFRREAEVIESQARIGRASLRLCELLNLDTTLRLRAVESQVVPQPIVPNKIPLAELLAFAMLDRPELKARQAAIRAALLELDSAKVLPFSPQLIVGFSGGLFGGGSNLVASATPPVKGLPPNQPRFGDFKDRTDIDAIAYWSLRNLGVGNKALIDAARARARSADFEELATFDRVRHEVADAYVRTHARFAEIDVRGRSVLSGADALAEDMIRVKGREGLPIEVLDSLRRLADSRREYLDAIVDYNEAEFDLYVALGNPPADKLARPVPQDLTRPQPTTPRNK